MCIQGVIPVRGSRGGNSSRLYSEPCFRIISGISAMCLRAAVSCLFQGQVARLEVVNNTLVRVYVKSDGVMDDFGPSDGTFRSAHTYTHAHTHVYMGCAHTHTYVWVAHVPMFQLTATAL